ncbi:hypothetical protein RFI_23967, partial [Reticulomyxa filosa]
MLSIYGLLFVILMACLWTASLRLLCYSCEECCNLCLHAIAKKRRPKTQMDTNKQEEEEEEKKEDEKKSAMLTVAEGDSKMGLRTTISSNSEYGDIPLDRNNLVSLVGISQLELKSILQFVDITDSIEKNYRIRFVTFVHNFRTFVILFLLTWTLLCATAGLVVVHGYAVSLPGGGSDHTLPAADHTKRTVLAITLVALSWCIYPFMELCRFFHREVYHIDLKSLVSAICLYLIIEYVVNQLQRLRKWCLGSFLTAMLCLFYLCLVKYLLRATSITDWTLDLCLLLWLGVVNYIFVIFIRQISFVQNSVKVWLETMKKERLQLIDQGKNVFGGQLLPHEMMITTNAATINANANANANANTNISININTNANNNDSYSILSCCKWCQRYRQKRLEQQWIENHLYPNGRIKAYSRYFIEPNMAAPLPPPSKPPMENIYFAK